MAGGLVSTRLVVAPQPAWRGIAGRARGARPVPLIAVGAGVVVLGLGTVAVTNGVLGPTAFDAASPSVRPSATPAMTREPTQRATPTPTLTPSASPSPSPSPTPVPTLSPTPAPLPATPVPTAPPPPPQQTYTVQQGDTLAEIAELFGTTTQALQQANGIDDPNEIAVGQVLVIP